jgi:hypothetical protein
MKYKTDKLNKAKIIKKTKTKQKSLIQVRHFFENKLTNQLENIKKTNTGKLCLYSNMFTKFQLHNYLHFLIAKEKNLGYEPSSVYIARLEALL